MASLPDSIYGFHAKDIDGKDISLSKYENKVCLIVNVASKWGLTKENYSQLVKLHEKLSSSGLSILAFPCNQFANQEPGSNEDIKKFAQENYHVKFDMFSKIDVNGKNAHPLFKYLQNHPKCKGFLTNSIKWNFTKFLINKQGVPHKRYGPKEAPFSFEDEIVKLLSN